jgi:hypothetical protein
VTVLAEALVVNVVVSWFHAVFVLHVLVPPSAPRYTFEPLTQADSVYVELGRTETDWLQRALSPEVGLPWRAQVPVWAEPLTAAPVPAEQDQPLREPVSKVPFVTRLVAAEPALGTSTIPATARKKVIRMIATVLRGRVRGFMTHKV